MKFFGTLAAWSFAALLASPALAGEGHDHGHDHDVAPASAAGPALPRFIAVSDLFELVGVVDGKHITLYFDHFADNSPVEGATLELELDGKPVLVERHGEGEFDAVLEQELAPGVISVMATIVAGAETDLLAGELDLHADAELGEGGRALDWKIYAGWFGAGALMLGLIGWGVSRKGRARNGSAGGAA